MFIERKEFTVSTASSVFLHRFTFLFLLSSFLFFPHYSRSLVIDSLTAIINRIMARQDESHTVHLLKALPLLHLLRGDCSPNEQSVMRPSAIKWKDPIIDLRATQQMMTYKKGSVVVCRYSHCIACFKSSHSTTHHLCYPYFV